MSLQIQKTPTRYRFKFRHVVYLASALLTISSCGDDSLTTANNDETNGKNIFTLMSSQQTGIDFRNDLQDSPELNILSYLYYYNGSGLSAADFNNDGLEDLFFAANAGTGELYLNKGDFTFEKVTKEALIDQVGWSTGTTVVDINSDGLMDLYICQVGGYKTLNNRNLLYVNQGVNKNGVPVFRESAKEYGLDFSGLSTQAAFFDYDLDGDLDMYLLNHSVHPIRNYGKGSKRKLSDKKSGDRLFRNNEGHYSDVTEGSGIFSSKIGYGLGIGVSDINNDGYPDIYVGNDFFENDYLYINQQNGTFKEIISEDQHKLGHTTHFSMGNDIADMNNDGLTDILSMDMLPEDLITYKSSGTEYEFSTYNNYLKNGYSPQYMQNTLHLNLGNNVFSEIAFLAGVAATEWSWSGLFMDFDNDGFKDIFVSNGIYGATNDMDYISFISNENIQKRLSKGMSEEDLEMVGEIPQKKIPNYFFKNNGDLTFEKLENTVPSFSNGAIYADLDNDGDLDIVTNNLNQTSFVYRNTSNDGPNPNNFLKVVLKGQDGNTLGIGARITVHAGSDEQHYECYPTRGYMSSVSPLINVGLGKHDLIDSLKVEWPGNKIQVLTNLAVNKTLTLSQANAKGKISAPVFLAKIADHELTIPFLHKERNSYSFNRDPLAPYMLSHLGPDITVGDINGDGLDDFFIGNGKAEKAALFVQGTNGFKRFKQPEIDLLDMTENVDNCFLDIDNDGDLDLVIANGGHEYVNDPNLKPSLFLNEQGQFKDASDRLPDIYQNFSVVAPADFDGDGDIDLFFGCSGESTSFGKTGQSYLLENDGNGHFKSVEEERIPGLAKVGIVQDATWADVNNDGQPDLVVVGHWMPVSIFLNQNRTLSKIATQGLEKSNGFWNCIAPADLDNDGDIDFVLGNWSDNSRLKASFKEPVRLYRNDFDDNGKTDDVMTYYFQGRNTVFPTKDALTKQIPSINKKFLSYHGFAEAKFIDLFDRQKIAEADVKEVYTTKNSVMINKGNNNFELLALPAIAQVSSCTSIKIDDFNKDGYKDMLLAGNNYQLNTQLSQLDASHGIILINDTKGNFSQDTDRQRLLQLNGAIRDIKDIRINEKPYYLIGRNNDSLQIFDTSKIIYE